MKELSIEEKAKAYDETIKKLRDFYRDYDTVSCLINVKEELANLFPELKESEDERIRKSLIENFRWFCGDYPETTKWGKDDNLLVKDIIAWLEKQGEKPKPSIRERYKRIANSEWFKKTHEGMSISDDEKVDNVNKIEPKFKVGDWITNGACVIQITSVDDRYYWHDNDCAGGDIESMDKEYHLWTIQDAKDGDILCTPNGNTFIFKIIDGDKILDYCGLYFNKFFSDSGSPNGSSTNYDKCNYHPATKEQRDLLFQKMKEDGYEWDAEKKELRKIEHKPACSDDKKLTDVNHEYFNELLENNNSKDINDYAYQVAYCMSHDWANEIPTWDDVQKACKLGAEWNENHHKGTWNEEDNRICKELISFFNDDEPFMTHSLEEYSNWLKSLKPQNRWKPSDAQMKALKEVCDEHWEPDGLDPLYTLYEQLKKL